MTSIQLTQTVQKGGCAAKISASVLREVLSEIKIVNTDPNVLVDGKDFDDAGIYKITDDLAMVQTLDFFTPIVDTPRLFGQIAAANALSDVYAMGGIPKTCMAILAFPLATLDSWIMRDVLQGAMDKISESQSSLVGGHSIDDDTLKFGLSVTGLVNPKYMWTNTGAKPGDKLIFTKPLGTGTLTAGLKKKNYTENDIEEAIQSMVKLNNVVNCISQDEQAFIHAATDITGFGLAGHSMQLAKGSKVGLEFNFSQLPLFKLAQDSLKREHLTKAHRTNKEYTKDHLRLENLNVVEEQLLYDPQTSGGLLLSVDCTQAEKILSKIKNNFPQAAIVGEVKPLKDKYVLVRN